jgi:hypothetical protein
MSAVDMALGNGHTGLGAVIQEARQTAVRYTPVTLL